MISRHPFLFVITVAVSLFLFAALITGGLIMHAASGSAGTFDYLVVLGCSVYGNTPSPMLKDRIQATAEYLQANPHVTCIVSGGKGDNENISEAQCMYQELTALGIDGNRIWLEDRATSTRENLKFSVELIAAKTDTTPEVIGILSSEFHLLRANMFADEKNVRAVCIPATTSRPGVFWKYFLREILMVWYYSTLGRVI